MTNEYLITYKRHHGTIDFEGKGVDIYYLFFVIHELGRLLYELEYDKTFTLNDLITLKHLNLEQTVSEIQRVLRYMSHHPSPSLELIAYVETVEDEDPLVTIEMIEHHQALSKEQLMSDLYLFQLFSHMNLLQGYTFDDSDVILNSDKDFLLT